jgi:ABC-type sugar transport system permease subunit
MKKRESNKPMSLKRDTVSFAFVTPALIIYVVLLIIPILIAFGFSFTNWNGVAVTPPKFIGFDNYKALFSDVRLGEAVGNTVLITAVVVISVNLIGLGLGLLLNKAGRMISVSRSVFFAPYVLSTVAISFIWLSILSYTGVFNSFLTSIGLEQFTSDFIGTKASALRSICLVEIWRTLGFHMVIYLAALQTVPQDLYEACTVDGGNSWHKFRYVTLPLIIPGITISFLMSIINELRMYDIVKVLTDGGPGYATETINAASPRPHRLL